jgi:hypothetical protein
LFLATNIEKNKSCKTSFLESAVNAPSRGMIIRSWTAPDTKHLPDGDTNLSWIVLARSIVLELMAKHHSDKGSVPKVGVYNPVS